MRHPYLFMIWADSLPLFYIGAESIPKPVLLWVTAVWGLIPAAVWTGRKLSRYLVTSFIRIGRPPPDENLDGAQEHFNREWTNDQKDAIKQVNQYIKRFDERLRKEES